MKLLHVHCRPVSWRRLTTRAESCDGVEDTSDTASDGTNDHLKEASDGRDDTRKETCD